MYLKIDSDVFADNELSYLQELLGCIDKILLDINTRIKTSADPESEGLCDKAEYFVGVGFCAIQRYLADVLEDKKIDKGAALQLGPKTAEGLPVSMLIHSAGNYWKHSPEWHIWLDRLDERSQRTVDRIMSYEGLVRYPLSEVLAGLCESGELSLLECIPILKEWRQSVDSKLPSKCS